MGDTPKMTDEQLVAGLNEDYGVLTSIGETEIARHVRTAAQRIEEQAELIEQMRRAAYKARSNADQFIFAVEEMALNHQKKHS